MKDKKYIVIHPEDISTDFLCSIYDDYGLERITQKRSNSYIFDSIKSADVIIMLGHGTGKGLIGKNGLGYHNVVDCRMVQALRDKTCIGIWCHADEFAEKYKLHGLFSGMIISEKEEAIFNNIEADVDEIRKENDRLSSLIKSGLNTVSLKDMPAYMKEMGGADTPLRNFNYSRFYYF